MNKEELVELLVKLQDLKRSISEDQKAAFSLLFKSLKIIPLSGRKLVRRSNSSLMNLWKPHLIQPLTDMM